MRGIPTAFSRRLVAPFLLATLAAGCAEPPGTATLTECPVDATPLHTIQGDDWTSPLTGQALAVTGVVTLSTDTGLYIESLEPDDDPRTSEGLFLAVDRAPFDTGAVVTAHGRVAELGERRDTQTALRDLTSLAACGAPRARPETRASLPLDNRERESLESMRIALDSASVVTDVYRLDEGEFRIALDGPLPQPTEVARPGREAQQQQRSNRSRELFSQLDPGDTAVFAVGDELLSDTGVLGHDGIGPRLLLETPARLMREPLTTVPAPARGVVRLASLNLQNYFNGDGRGGGFPTPRGADNPDAFSVQRARLRGAVEHLQPHVLAVMELENDGFGPHSAAQDLLADLADATGGEWAVVEPRAARVGTDEIAVGLFYRRDLLDASGPAWMLDAAPFDLLSRTPLAQVFTTRDGGPFLVSVNHFKSKGSCPDHGRDQDQNDGQGCWNAARVAAARALAPWVAQLADDGAQGRGIILGDLNAYRMEDPVRQLLMAGFADLTAPVGERHRYSYVYRGQSGTLDHAMATPALAAAVAGVRIWNVNAGQPRRLPLEPAWLGASDHDPVIVDLRLTQLSTSD